MSTLRDTVVSSTLDRVQVVYVDRTTAKWWNSRKDKDDVATFCGFYWLRGREEAGPFKTRSSCLRDAYYRFVLKREVPNVLGRGSPSLPKSSSPRSKSYTTHQGAAA